MRVLGSGSKASRSTSDTTSWVQPSSTPGPASSIVAACRSIRDPRQCTGSDRPCGPGRWLVRTRARGGRGRPCRPPAGRGGNGGLWPSIRLPRCHSGSHTGRTGSTTSLRRRNHGVHGGSNLAHRSGPSGCQTAFPTSSRSAAACRRKEPAVHRPEKRDAADDHREGGDDALREVEALVEGGHVTNRRRSV